MRTLGPVSTTAHLSMEDGFGEAYGYGEKGDDMPRIDERLPAGTDAYDWILSNCLTCVKNQGDCSLIEGIITCPTCAEVAGVVIMEGSDLEGSRDLTDTSYTMMTDDGKCTEHATA